MRTHWKENWQASLTFGSLMVLVGWGTRQLGGGPPLEVEKLLFVFGFCAMSSLVMLVGLDLVAAAWTALKTAVKGRDSSVTKI